MKSVGFGQVIAAAETLDGLYFGLLAEFHPLLWNGASKRLSPPLEFKLVQSRFGLSSWSLMRCSGTTASCLHPTGSAAPADLRHTVQTLREGNIHLHKILNLIIHSISVDSI